jgi:hypothetical protein
MREGILAKCTSGFSIQLWNGSVATTREGSPYTLFTRDETLFEAAAETVEVKLSEQEEAVFDSFPLSLGGGKDAIELAFLGNPLNFLKLDGDPATESHVFEVRWPDSVRKGLRPRKPICLPCAARRL